MSGGRPTTTTLHTHTTVRIKVKDVYVCLLRYQSMDLLPHMLCITGPAAMVRPVRPWLYQFFREKKWRHLDSKLCVHYRMASPSGSP